MADKRVERTVPLLYLGTAHVSLALAFLFAGCWPEAVAGFFYHSWLIALVHLVTLGWISFSIVGAFYIVALSAYVESATYVLSQGVSPELLRELTRSTLATLQSTTAEATAPPTAPIRGSPRPPRMRR